MRKMKNVAQRGIEPEQGRRERMKREGGEREQAVRQMKETCEWKVRMITERRSNREREREACCWREA